MARRWGSLHRKTYEAACKRRTDALETINSALCRRYRQVHCAGWANRLLTALQNVRGIRIGPGADDVLPVGVVELRADVLPAVHRRLLQEGQDALERSREQQEAEAIAEAIATRKMRIPSGTTQPSTCTALWGSVTSGGHPTAGT